MTDQQISKAAKDYLLTVDSPENWRDFLFEMQNHLIESGYFESTSKEYSGRVASYFNTMNTFFKATASALKPAVVS